MDMATGALEPPAAAMDSPEAQHDAEVASLALAVLVRLTAHAGAGSATNAFMIGPPPERPTARFQRTGIAIELPWITACHCRMQSHKAALQVMKPRRHTRVYAPS